MAARTISISRGLFSCNAHSSLRIVCTAVRPKALQFTNVTRLSSFIKSRASTFSTCNNQVNTWKSGMPLMKNLPRNLNASQSIYAFDCVSSFAKQAQLVQSSGVLITNTRSVNTHNKHGKPKTVKAVAKRFFRTGNGQLKYWPPGKNHKMMKKGPRKSRKLRQPRLCNKQQLKLLNKMLGRYC